MIRLIDDINKYPSYWSVRLGALALIMSILEVLNAFSVVLPVFEHTMSPGLFAGLSAAFALAGLIARAIKQTYPEVATVKDEQEADDEQST